MADVADGLSGFIHSHRVALDALADLLGRQLVHSHGDDACPVMLIVERAGCSDVARVGCIRCLC